MFDTKRKRRDDAWSRLRTEEDNRSRLEARKQKLSNDLKGLQTEEKNINAELVTIRENHRQLMCNAEDVERRLNEVRRMHEQVQAELRELQDRRDRSLKSASEHLITVKNITV